MDDYINPDTERLTVALFIATFLHAVIIYGVGFIKPKPPKSIKTTTMEVILVQKRTENKPKKANYLAQATHEGSGEFKKNLQARPITPTIAPFPAQTAALVFTPPPPQIAAVSKAHKKEILTTTKKAAHQSHQTITLPKKTPKKITEQGKASQTSEIEEYISENSLFINASAIKLASIQAELENKFQDYSKRPRRKFISSSTQEYKYASYMDTWRRKVEDIGNSNYPDKARNKKLSGNLILDVALNPDGTIREVDIKKPSKYKILDEAALRIIHLAAPFEQFPDNISKETEILHIIRTWEFSYNSLTSR